jgi:predicted SprT family Zn-dependent metalloprotease
MARLANRAASDNEDDLPDVATIMRRSRPAANGCSSQNAAQVSRATAFTKVPKLEPKTLFHHDDCFDDSGTGSPRKVRKKILIKENGDAFTRPQVQARSRTPPPLTGKTWGRTPRSTVRRVQNRPRSPSLSDEVPSHLDDAESDGLSDFIVSDSASVGGGSSDSNDEPLPPRSARRLVRKKDLSKELDTKLRKLSLGGEEGWCRDSDKENGPERRPTMSRSKGDTPHGTPSRRRMPGSSEDGTKTDGRYRPQTPSRGRSPETSNEVPAKTPKRLTSPSKKRVLASHTPRFSMNSFWNQAAINEWHEEYREIMTPRPQPSPERKKPEMSARTPAPVSPEKKKEKLSQQKAFETVKNRLADDFLRELDMDITGGKLSELAASTGGIKIIWNKKLNTTAGRANWKRERIKSSIREENQSPSKATMTYKHHASIELAEKVINDTDRLLNVIAHEFCHLANFMISGVTNNPHGKEFKEWAAKCSSRFKDRGICVTTKHSYDIEYKYIWECGECYTQFKRHSKSIDPGRHRCGACKGTLAQIKPLPRKNGTMSEYQVFVKENMAKLKKDNPGSPQKDIMGLLGKMYQEQKQSKLVDVVVSEVGREEILDITERDASPEDGEVESVVRKLDFLDLTSP